jgi:hypothetical protein
MFRFASPLCSKSVCDMSKAWERLDMELATMSDSCDKMVMLCYTFLLRIYSPFCRYKLKPEYEHIVVGYSSIELAGDNTLETVGVQFSRYKL